MGYQDLISRVTELRTMARGPQAAGATSAQDGATAAARFQQQMLAAGLSADTGTGDASTTPTLPGTTDPYAALQGGGLSMQSALMAQLTGGAGASGGTGANGLAALLGTGPAPGATGTAAAPATTTPAFVTGKTADLDPELLSRLDALGRQLSQPIDVISGNRTYQEQAALYQKYLNGTGNLAAPPGQSNHEHGDAADAYVNGVALANVPGAREAAARLGLHFPVGGEAWHVERSDG